MSFLFYNPYISQTEGSRQLLIMGVEIEKLTTKTNGRSRPWFVKYFHTFKAASANIHTSKCYSKTFFFNVCVCGQTRLIPLKKKIETKNKSNSLKPKKKLLFKFESRTTRKQLLKNIHTLRLQNIYKSRNPKKKHFTL